MSGDFKSMNELLGDQISHGQSLGFKTGGHVKMPRSGSHGPMKSGPQNPMDNANVKRKRKDAADQRTKEMGDQPDVQPEFKSGGKVKKKKSPDHTKGKGMSRKGMPKKVKKKGGKVGKRKPYSGYNEQAGGGGNEDDRYMAKKGGRAKKKQAGGSVPGSASGMRANRRKGGSC